MTPYSKLINPASCDVTSAARSSTKREVKISAIKDTSVIPTDIACESALVEPTPRVVSVMTCAVSRSPAHDAADHRSKEHEGLAQQHVSTIMAVCRVPH